MARIFNSPSKYIQGPDALAELGTHVAPLGSKLLAIATPAGIERVGDKVHRGFAGADADVIFEAFEGECSDREIERLCGIAREQGCDVVAGIGGGKVLDTAKAVAHFLSAPVVVCPTAASSDAPCSALSVVYTDEGVFDRYLFLPANPNIVLMDTTVIAGAPVRLAISGMGDALATYFEAKACVDSEADTCAGGKSTSAALVLARLCFDTLMADGVKAKVALEAGCSTPAVEHVIEANTLLSGIGFESCGLAAAHAVHNGMTQLPETHAMLHGEKVAFGTLVQLVLENAPTETFEQVMGFCLEVDLPVTLGDLGVEDISRERIMAVAEAACAPTDTMGNLPFAVTPNMVCDAILAADALGRYYSLEE